MNKKTLLIGAIIVILIIVAVVTMRGNDTDAPARPDGAYQDVATGFSFDYPKGDKYVVQEPAIDAATQGDLMKAVILIPSADFAELQSAEAGREGPPTINVLVFRNTAGLSPVEWFEATGVTEQNTRMIDGKEAIVFDSDGLYASRNVVASAHGLLYFISGAFVNQDSDIYRDFDMVLDTFVFNSEVTVNGGVEKVEKLNDGSTRITIVNESGVKDIVVIPQNGTELCAAASRIGDSADATKADIVQAFGDRTSDGTVLPCSTEQHYFTLLDDSLPDTPPTSEQG